jgi:hypothetical protein
MAYSRLKLCWNSQVAVHKLASTSTQIALSFWIVSRTVTTMILQQNRISPSNPRQSPHLGGTLVPPFLLLISFKFTLDSIVGIDHKLKTD